MLGTQSIGVRLFRSAREKKTRLRFPEIIDLGCSSTAAPTTYGGGVGGQLDKEDEDDAEEEGTEEVLKNTVVVLRSGIDSGNKKRATS